MTLTATTLTQRYAIAAMQGSVRKIVVSSELRAGCDAFFTTYAPMLAADATAVIVSHDLSPDDVIFLGGLHDEHVVH